MDAIRVDRHRDVIGRSLGLVAGVAHRHAKSHLTQHLHVVLSVAERHGLLQGDAMSVEKCPYALWLRPVRRDDVYGARVPPGHPTVRQESDERT